MKKVAVVITDMIVGGAEKALIEMLKRVDHINYSWTVFTWDENGAFIDLIPEYVSVKYLKYGADTKERLISNIKSVRLIPIFKDLYYRFAMRLTKDIYRKRIYMEKCKEKIREKFDCAIAYKLNFPDTSCICYRMDAKKRCAFLHSTVNRAEKAKEHTRPCSFYYKLDDIEKIFCVSEDVKNGLICIAPHLEGKTGVIHNFYDCDEILSNASEEVKDVTFKDFTIVSVGRLSYEKGQMMVPKACKMLLDDGYNVKWYLVGYGPQRAELEQEIKKQCVENNVILLGTKLNPYPYIKSCTVFVQPSFSEGYCTTTMEAKILHKPIVTTDVSGMREQFVSGKNGLIVEVSAEGLYMGIKQLLDNPEMQEAFSKNLENEDFGNLDELQKLYDFIES